MPPTTTQAASPRRSAASTAGGGGGGGSSGGGGASGGSGRNYERIKSISDDVKKVKDLVTGHNVRDILRYR